MTRRYVSLPILLESQRRPWADGTPPTSFVKLDFFDHLKEKQDCSFVKLAANSGQVCNGSRGYEMLVDATTPPLRGDTRSRNTTATFKHRGAARVLGPTATNVPSLLLLYTTLEMATVSFSPLCGCRRKSYTPCNTLQQAHQRQVILVLRNAGDAPTPRRLTRVRKK